VTAELLWEQPIEVKKKLRAVEFTLAARYLPPPQGKKSLSTYITVATLQSATGRYRKQDETAVLPYDLDLQFYKRFKLPSRGPDGKDTLLKLKVFQVKEGQEPSASARPIGSALVSLSAIAGRRERTSHFQLLDSRKEQVGEGALVSLTRLSSDAKDDADDAGPNSHTLTILASCKHIGTRQPVSVQLFARDSVTRKLALVSATEVQANLRTGEVDFQHPFVVEHRLGEDAELEFRVCRARGGSTPARRRGQHDPDLGVLSDDVLGLLNCNVTALSECAMMHTDLSRRLLDPWSGIQAVKAGISLSVKSSLGSEGKTPVTLKLSIKCQDLIKMDRDSDSDPIVSVLIKDPLTRKFVHHSQTEHIENEHNPSFKRKLVVHTYMEDELRFNVYDVDDNQVFEDRRMGSVTARVADLCDAQASQKYYIRHESNSSRDGELKSRDSAILFDPHVFTAKPKFVAPRPGSGTAITFAISCRYLPLRGGRHAPDPCLHLLMTDADSQEYELVGKTEARPGTTSPDFPDLFKYELFKDAPDQEIKVNVYDSADGESNPSGRDLLGYVVASLRDVVEGGAGVTSLRLLDAKSDNPLGHAVVQLRRTFPLQDVSGSMLVRVRCKSLAGARDVPTTLAVFYRDKNNAGELVHFVSLPTHGRSRNPVYESVVCLPYRSNVDREVEFRVYDAEQAAGLIATDEAAPGALVGSVATTLQALTKAFKPEPKSASGERDSERNSGRNGGRDGDAKTKDRRAGDNADTNNVVVATLLDSLGDSSGGIELSPRLLLLPAHKKPCTLALRLSCRDLFSLDSDGSDSDPMVVVSVRDMVTGEWRFHSRTEKIDNNHNPRFQCQLKVETYLEDDLLFAVYDVDEATGAYQEEDLIGTQHHCDSTVTAL
jgi:hypothetical protein